MSQGMAHAWQITENKAPILMNQGMDHGWQIRDIRKHIFWWTRSMAKIHISQKMQLSVHWSSCLKPSLLWCRQNCMTCFSRVVPTSCNHSTRKPLLRGNFFLRDIDVRLSNRSSSDYFRRFLLIVREPVVVSSGLILIWRDGYTASRVNTFIITHISSKKGLLIRVKRMKNHAWGDWWPPRITRPARRATGATLALECLGDRENARTTHHLHFMSVDNKKAKEGALVTC